MSFLRPFVGLLVLLGLGLVQSSFGQTFGSITGVVTDSSGGIVAGATVTVTNPQTNATRTATTNASGNYVFPALLPGVYDVRVEAQGFQPEVRNGVQLQVQQEARLDFQLKVGSLTEAVEVTGGAPLLTTENATVGTVIDNQRIIDLPLNGRNFTALISLSPNVVSGFGTNGAASREGGDRSTVAQIAVGGQRQEWNYYTLDGVSNTDVNYGSYSFLPSIDALQEFKVQTGIYSAEFGRESTQINVSTVSGTNQYHGVLFDFVRNNDFDARPFGFTSSVPVSAPFKWNQFGFTLGGPVRIPKLFNGKDKLFFMANYEGFRLRQQTQNVYTTAPQSMRGGDFSSILPAKVITDPTTNQPFPGNMIPSTRFDAAALAMLAFYPLPNISGAGLKNNYLAIDSDQTNKDLFLTRIDFMESTKSTWFGRYNFQNENNVTPALYKNGTLLAVGVQQGMISNVRVLKPTLVNEFRFGYGGFYNNFGNELQNQFNGNQVLGFGAIDPPPAGWGTPNITLTVFSSFGTPVGGPFVTNDHTFQWVDSLAWSKGKHSFKFGAEIRRDQFNEAGNQDLRGQFTVNGQATGYEFADYMLGYVGQLQDAATLGISQFRATSQAYYADDSWKVRPNLTLSLGLRYEYVPPWTDKGGSEVNVWIPPDFPMAPVGSYAATKGDTTTPFTYAGQHPCFVRQGMGNVYTDPSPTLARFNPAICAVEDGRLGSRLVRPDYKNFAPRLGLAWSPFRRTTVRAGWGIFYVQDIGNTVWDMDANLAAHVQDVANPVTHDLTFEHPFTAGANGACGVPSPPYVCISTPQGLSNQNNRATAYEEMYELNVQQQLTSDTVLEVGYLGSEGHHLQALLTYNEPLYMSATVAVTPRRPAPEFGNIQYLANVANSDYNALSMKLTRRLSKGLTFLVGYTFAKSIDESSGPRPIAGDNVLTPQDGTDWREENRGRSSFDARQRFVVSALYNLPIGKGHTYLNHGIASTLIGGWQIGSIYTFQTGLPFSISDGVDQSNTGETHDLASVVSGQTVKLANPSTGEWFNTAAFALQPKGTYGNSGRNIVTAPGINALNSTLQKNFNFTERIFLQVRFEAFNTLNHPNFYLPNSTVTSASFGQITALQNNIDMRELQLSMKLVF
ncbi:MAG TPA: carboxypeptidase regulatory-like domain-containing protein [Bryobacteraceae bacterium]|nr:carboxypeptidase regulatory-like domain-containing protein [Bryobacteraceae bacterium]